MKKYIIILIGLVFVFNSSIANDDYKKEKKALVKTIKKEYVSWLVRDKKDWNVENSEKIDTINESISGFNTVQVTNHKLDYIPDPVVPASRLTDFKFQIQNNQAVVKFRTGYHMKSAFLEKESGVWKLLLVADQSSSL